VADRDLVVGELEREAPFSPILFGQRSQRSRIDVLRHPRHAADRIGVLSVTDGAVVAEFERQFQALWREATVLQE